MRRSQWRKLAQYVKNSRYRHAWHKVVQMLACIVVFCTTYALILPAITVEQTYFCEMEAHEHTEECYIQETDTRLNCPLPERVAHTHGEACYAAEELVCNLPQWEPHSHGEGCFAESGEQICTLEEGFEHIHEETCYVTETRDVRICERDVHTHTDTCRSNPQADLETPADWESTLQYVTLTGDWAKDLTAVASSQLGYRESQLNYLAEEGQPHKGYTRYGAWYGVPYGQWDAMFVSFCLNYAGIPQEAIGWSADSSAWVEALRSRELTAGAMNKVPDAGDLLFYQASEASPVRSAIVLGMEVQENSEDGSLTHTLRIVEGAWEHRVVQRQVDLEEITLLGCCGTGLVQQSWISLHSQTIEEATLPTETTETTEATEVPETSEGTEPTEATEVPETAEGTEPTEAPANTEPTEETEAAAEPEKISRTEQTENYVVTVTYPADLVLPEGTVLRVVEYPKDSDIFRQRCEEAGYELEWLLNIGFFLEDQELELDGAFEVLVTSKLGQNLGQDITHFAEDGAERITGASVTEDGQSAVSFSAGSFSDFGGGVALAAEAGNAVMPAADAEITGFRFTTVDPWQLKENTDYVIYTGSGTFHNFMSSGLSSVKLNGTDGNAPYRVGGSWSLNTNVFGTSQVTERSWRIERSGNNFYLRSQQSGNYLRLNNGWSSLEGSRSNASQLRPTRVNGAAAEVGDGTYHIRYEDDGGWKSTWHNDNWSYWTSPTQIYFAEITPIYSSRNYPHAVHTGDVEINRLRFYNICDNGENGVSALAGCVFEIRDANGNSFTVTSGDSPEVNLPTNIPDGTYTITELSAPDGYMRDTEYQRTFTIKNHMLVSDSNIGTFINHNLEQLTAGKTAEVEDYNNRIYQVLLEAESHLRMFEMDPVDVLFVVDQSNSMLFPSGMVDTGKDVTLRLDGVNNAANLDALNLDKTKMHYLIADASLTSTVYCIWHDGTAWMYQDASYYAKAKHGNEGGYQTPGEEAIFPSNRSYTDQANAEKNTGTRSNGGGIGYSLSGCKLGDDIASTANDIKTFRLYTSTDEYNRLHYLEEALANMIYELADVNDKNTVTLTGFTKEVAVEDCIGPLELSPENADRLVDSVTNIHTSGGTRQDLALKHIHEEHLGNAGKHYDKDIQHTYTILITDGAPVRSSGSNLSNLGSPYDAPTTTGDTIYGQIKGYAAEVRKNSTLMTVGLGLDSVEGGKAVLEQIASSDGYYCALDDAADLVRTIQELMFDSFRAKETINISGDVVDEISDSFYPIAWYDPLGAYATGRTVLAQSNGKAWLQLQEGDWITLDGRFTTPGAADAAGQLLRKDDGTFYVQWTNQPFNYGDGWNGTFYLKAKEDFIGGNAIDTNKSASVVSNLATKRFETPTVNVHLLDMNENSSEVTVYLGDLINGEGSSPGDVMKDFYSKIGFTKIQDESQITDLEMMNRLDPDSSTADGLERNFFFLKYALGYQGTDGNWVPRILTNDEWVTLMSGGSLTFPYVYDDASSHGNVGFFTITLNKTSDTYDEHIAETACQPGGQPLTENCTDPAETYTLTVTYTAYELGEQGRPETNVHNGSGSPGTEVTKRAQGLNNGQGIITSENIHEVHVISGKIVVEKIFTEGTEWTAGDTFTFQLTGPGDTVISHTVTIGADGTAAAVFDNLSRGTYTVTEAMDEEYAVKTVTVGETTNAYYTQPDPMQVSFTMGNNLADENVIGKADESDAFTSYIDPVNGVYGEAVFANAPRIYTGEVPVEKIWDDGAEIHVYDEVYLVLYLDDQPALDTDGNARLLRVDASTNWEGIFTVVLANKDDSVDNYHYSVREVANTSDAALNGWHPAILENDGETILYYDEALEDGGLLGISGKGYIVGYTTAENGTLVVTNYKGFDLPETGGMGTHGHTIGGLACILAALMYGYSLRRKRERGANS